MLLLRVIRWLSIGTKTPVLALLKQLYVVLCIFVIMEQ